MKKIALLLSIFLLFFSFSFSALALDYPTNNITIIVPAVPGGGYDATARSIAAGGTQYFGVGFIIRNVPGAGFTIGTTETARSNPDGYTFLATSGSPITISPHLMELEYDVYKLEHLAGLAVAHNGIYAYSGSNFTTLEEVLAYAKDNPNELRVSVSAAFLELWAQLLATKGYEFVVVPYPGGAAAAAAGAGGIVNLFFGSWAAAAPFIESGDLIPLMVSPEIDLPGSVPEGTPTIVDFPEINELFGPLDREYFSLHAPKGISEDRLQFIDEALYETFQDPGFQSMATRLALVPSFVPREEYTKLMIETYEYAKKLIQELAGE